MNKQTIKKLEDAIEEQEAKLRNGEINLARVAYITELKDRLDNIRKSI